MTKSKARFSLFFLVMVCVSSVARATPYRLDELLDMARKGNPGLAAGARATASIEAQLLEAKRMYYPTGELSSYLAQAPKIKCDVPRNADNTPAYAYSGAVEDNCANTNNIGHGASGFLNAITPAGVFTRTELRLVQPVYTFGKLTAGVSAANSGVRASRDREIGLLADLELSVRKAFWGAKLAREILATLREGSDFLDQAQKKIEEELKDGSGDASITDRLRLRTMRAEIDARILEANRGVDVARSGLRALIGPDAPADLDVDQEAIESVAVPAKPLTDYEQTALRSRPEVAALDHLVAAKRSLAEVEYRRQYPDVVLIGTLSYAYASSVDTPRNAYYNDPFHGSGGGLAAGFRWPLDLGVKNAHAAKLRAEADEAEQKRREGLTGISFEVEKAYTELKEAEARMKVVHAGEKAGRQWIAAVAQNVAVGLSEAKDFSDALLAFFQARIRYLQSIYDYNVAAAALARATGVDVAAKTAEP